MLTDVSHLNLDAVINDGVTKGGRRLPCLFVLMLTAQLGPAKVELPPGSEAEAQLQAAMGQTAVTFFPVVLVEGTLRVLRNAKLEPRTLR